MRQLRYIVLGVLLFAGAVILPYMKSKARAADRVMIESIEAEAILLEGPKTLETAKAFRDRLAGIDTRRAPREVRAAMERYVAAIDDHATAHRTGGDTNRANEVVVAAKRNLHQVIDRHRARAY